MTGCQFAHTCADLNGIFGEDYHFVPDWPEKYEERGYTTVRVLRCGSQNLPWIVDPDATLSDWMNNGMFVAMKSQEDNTCIEQDKKPQRCRSKCRRWHRKMDLFAKAFNEWRSYLDTIRVLETITRFPIPGMAANGKI